MSAGSLGPDFANTARVKPDRNSMLPALHPYVKWGCTVPTAIMPAPWLRLRRQQRMPVKNGPRDVDGASIRRAGRAQIRKNGCS